MFLVPAYRQQLKLSKPVKRNVQDFNDESVEHLQACLEATDWDTFKNVSADLDEYTDTVTQYISFCVDSCIPTRTVVTYPNQKPWFTKDIRDKMHARNEAFKRGDQLGYKTCRYQVINAIKLAKRDYRCKLDTQFREQDSRSLWRGLQAITSYKGVMKCNNSDPNLPDNLNEFYARFDRANTLTRMSIQTDNNITLAFTEPEVRKIFRKTHARKAAGPDGIRSRVVKMCASQISGIFTDIFNQSLRYCIVPKCFKQSTIIPVPKKSSVSCLNDYRPVALTSVIMKGFERLILAYIKSVIPNTTDPYQFAYRENRSVDDAVCLALDSVYKHLDKRNTYARMLFIDYSSAFNTIIPSKLYMKLTDLGLCCQLCNWIYDFLSDRTQTVRVGNLVSSPLVINTGAPQGCVLSPLLYSLYTYDCKPRYDSNIIIKFADDTTVIGLISDDDESAYRDDVNHLVRWCASNDLVLNVSKTKEIVVDFRKSKSVPSTLIVNNSEVEIVDSFKFLGIHITSNLSWSLQARYMCKKGQQRLYFLRCLKKFHMKPEILVNLYRSIIESILTGSIMVWFGNMTDADRNSLSRVIRTARRLTGVDLPDLREIFYCRMKSRIHKVIADPSHPAFTFFELLPSGKRYRSLGYSGMSARTSNSLYPTAVRVLNDHIH